MEKKIQGAPKGNKNAEKQSTQVGNFVKRPKTGENIANEYGVNKSTYLVNGQNDHQPKIINQKHHIYIFRI